MKFRWSEWLTAAALIFAFSAFAGADIAHDAAPEPTVSQAPAPALPGALKVRVRATLLREAFGDWVQSQGGGRSGLRRASTRFRPASLLFGHAPRHRHRCWRPKNTLP